MLLDDLLPSLRNSLDLSVWLGLATAAAVAALSCLALCCALRIALARAERFTRRTSSPWDDLLVEVLSGTHRGLILLASLLIGAGFLDLDDRWHHRVSQLWFAALALQLALWGQRAISAGMRHYQTRQGEGLPVSASATLLSWALRTVLWTVVVLAVLSNLGVNITAFIASLGVGGIAVALAAQNILADLFASLAIAVDKPFEVGDSIAVGGVSGTVEQVGLKTTRIRSLNGEQIVMANTDLLRQTVSNYKRLQRRRVQFGFGITCETAPGQVEAVPALVRRIIEAQPQLSFGRAHFKAFGESSLDFEVVYHVDDPSYELYMDMQQLINLALMRALAEQGIGFAYPTRTLLLSCGAAQRSPSAEAAGPITPAALRSASSPSR